MAYYVPTPAQIEQATARIRARWSERVRQNRAGWYFEGLPVIAQEFFTEQLRRELRDG
jgi:hypothetical protein